MACIHTCRLSIGQGTGFEYMTPPWLQYEGYGIQVGTALLLCMLWQHPALSLLVALLPLPLLLATGDKQRHPQRVGRWAGCCWRLQRARRTQQHV